MHRLLYFFIIVAFFACEDEPKKKALYFESQEDYEATMILSHQEFLKKEKEKIKKFTDSLNVEFVSTGTGLRYYKQLETSGDSLKTGDLAIIAYTLTSIQGDTLYQSPKGKLQEFFVDYDDVETGLHEGIKKMKVGEKAMFILPAHLAHGVSGDNAAIPSQTTLVYQIYLVGKK